MLEVTPEHYSRLIAIGRESTCALNDRELARYPENDRLSGVYGAIRFEDLGETAGRLHQRNVTVFGHRWVDRSSCGSGNKAGSRCSPTQGDSELARYSPTTRSAARGSLAGHAQFPAATRGVRALRRSRAWHTRPKKTISCSIRPT